MHADEQMVDSVEMGRLLKKSPFTIRKMARNGDIPAHKLGGTWRFYPTQVREHLTRPTGVEPVAAVPRPQARHARRLTPHMTEAGAVTPAPTRRRNQLMSTDSLSRMSHRSDPDTSHDAAKRVRRGDKLPLLYGSITGILTVDGPLTAKEIHAIYAGLSADVGWLPDADLQDIRRRLTELQHDQGRVVDTGDRRNGERILALSGFEAVA